MFETEKLVRSAYRHLDLASLLRQPIDVLMGVSPAAKDELRDQNIVTVLDLAASALFREAAMLVAAADDPNSEWALAAGAPRTVVDSEIVQLPVEIIADRQIQDLRSFSDTVAGRISAALTVSTIRELAAWPPYLAARQILQQLNGRPDPDAVWDPGTPPELVPTMGRHPTERAYYQTILLDRFIDPAAENARFREKAWLAQWKPWQHTASVPLEAAGQVDIASSLLNSPGFDRVAVGALVQFSQSWYGSGLSLGQLLHSLALAPGESTRIAMIDWQRRERGSRKEGTQEFDQLTSDMAHNRALNEVVDAVASEIQTGLSASQVVGASAGFGKSGGGGGTYGGEGQSYGFGGGYSLGISSGFSTASSWGVSTGNRNLRSELTQNIQDLTHQASTMARSRWATVVQEVSQQEHEQLSTRAVTNYNHMHALTMQYYEVVQIYRVAIEIDRITRCLFVPMQVIDFQRREVVSRFRAVIAAVALIPQVRTVFRSAAGTVILTLPSPALVWNMSRLVALYGAQAWTPGSRDAVVPADDWTSLVIGTNAEGHPFRALVIERHDGTTDVVPWSIGDRQAPDAGAPHGLYDYATAPAPQPAGLQLSTIRHLLLRRGGDQAAFTGNVDIVIRSISIKGDGPVWCTITVPVEAGTTDIPFLDLDRGIDYSEVADHLRDNALYYSQAVWRSLDSAAISLALAGYTFAGKPLMEAIDPTPVTVAGNYMVFRTYAADEAWSAFLDSKKLSLGPVSSTVIPLPTAGVFVEAVLGRANSAEKLDMTRFWNWQDSPIPIAAPEIAALQAGSRQQPMNLDTGKLSPSVLNIMNPTQLPDPTGMTAALNALAQGTMFRDMSGLAATIGLAGTGLQEAFKGSSDAQKYAMENFKTAASLITKSGGSKSSTASEDGAKINQGKDMDKRGVSNSSGERSGGGGAARSGGEGGGSTAEGGGGRGGSWEGSAMEESTSGGASRMERMLNSLLLGAKPKGGGEEGSVAGKVAEEVVNLGVKFVDRAIESLATVPELVLEAPGINSNEYCHALLNDYPNPDRYIRGAKGYVDVYLRHLGAGGVINFTDGFSARLQVSWEDVHLDAAQISAADRRRTGALISVACKRNIGFIWSDYSAVGLRRATARASIKLKSANIVAKVIGGPKETVECEVQVEFGYTESGLINPETRGSSVTFNLPLVTDLISQAMYITVIEDTWTNDEKQFKITRTPFE